VLRSFIILYLPESLSHDKKVTIENVGLLALAVEDLEVRNLCKRYYIEKGGEEK